MYIEQLYTTCLAEAAYYIESEGEAIVIDPIRETTPYLNLAAKRGSRIRYIFETHFHADFVSGHLDLAKKTGASIVYGPGAQTAYDTYTAKDGERFQLGKLSIEVLHTPGHTPESSCYLLRDENENPVAVFTGDTLFVGDVGRPDLAIKSDLTINDLAGMLYDSLRTKIMTLPDAVTVYPAHGAGSSCGKNIGKETFSTIGEQKATNYALQSMSKADFVLAVTEGLSAPPAYFFQDALINKNGYDSLDVVKERNIKALTTTAVKSLLESGSLPLDTRPVLDFEKGFIAGSLSIGLDGQFAIWAATLLDIRQPLVVVVDDAAKAEEAIIRLARVGYERVDGYVVYSEAAFKKAGLEIETLVSVTAQQAADMQLEGVAILDVRKPGEYASGHIEGATHLCLSTLNEQKGQLNKEQPYLVHCAGGYRSVIAVSMLKKAGFNQLINIYGGWGAMKDVSGFPVTTPV
jgi:glyoxylase-like metal-dependent hydrolase (beta-lactamase superfamily II)/rhodanese-related sulfurtransferase